MDDLDRLYAAPLSEFVAVRNEIASLLRSRGDDEGARLAKALAKPSAVAWTVNQLARRHPQEMGELLDAGERLRKAHRKALSMRAGADDLREIAVEERAILRRLLALAESIMKDAGIAVSRTHTGAIEETLSAAAVDDEARELLRQGRLTKQMQRVGFGDVSGLTVIPGGRDSAEAGADAGARAQARELERLARAAEREAERRERIAESAATRVEAAKEKLGEAEAAAAQAAAAAAEARREADQARTAADEASV